LNVNNSSNSRNSSFNRRGNSYTSQRPRNLNQRAGNINNNRVITEPSTSNSRPNGGHQSSVTPPEITHVSAVTTSAPTSIEPLEVESDGAPEQHLSKQTVYQTTMVRVKGVPMRVLLDTGAIRSFITESEVKAANLKVKTAQELSISGAVGSRRTL